MTMAPEATDPTPLQFHSILQAGAQRPLAERKGLYSTAAIAYAQFRPRYPVALLEAAIATAGLTAHSRLLEIGCGPGTATQTLAAWGYEIVGLEPNPDFYRLAQQTLAPYPQVTLHPMAFEEWPVSPEPFDAVIAASSFHWIPAAIAYPKAAQALGDRGHLILLWNKQLQPSAAIYDQLRPLYQRYAPHLEHYETPAEQLQIIEQLGHGLLASGYFHDLHTGHVWVETDWAIADYLGLLSTYSPYIQLAAAQRETLFAALGDRLQTLCGPTISLTNVIAYHVARPRSG